MQVLILSVPIRQRPDKWLTVLFVFPVNKELFELIE
jgi:hypothetical protein